MPPSEPSAFAPSERSGFAPSGLTGFARWERRQCPPTERALSFPAEHRRSGRAPAVSSGRSRRCPFPQSNGSSRVSPSAIGSLPAMTNTTEGNGRAKVCDRREHRATLCATPGGSPACESLSRPFSSPLFFFDSPPRGFPEPFSDVTCSLASPGFPRFCQALIFVQPLIVLLLRLFKILPDASPFLF